jgi:hypothetical protein
VSVSILETLLFRRQQVDPFEDSVLRLGDRQHGPAT